ncbi:MAG: 30S ribosomal protein S11 [Candidatus Micrarchaeota archaeon]|nr:30S ribosomal protein S11 [Candidatus Micrarchaeota archaeon]
MTTDKEKKIKEVAEPVAEAKKEVKETKEVPKETKDVKEVAVAAPVVPQIKKGKPRVAILHVFSSKNDTIITATDLSGAETLAWASGGMIVKADREEGRPYAAMQAALKVITVLKDKGISMVHIRIRAPGGVGLKTPGPGAQAVVRTIARTGVRISRIEDVTPLPTDSMKRKGGRRGRRV